MANTYKDIVITPSRGDANNDPIIKFSAGDATSNLDMNVRFYAVSNGTLSFEGTSGQLFSITNDLTGTIFSVNDISGIPSIEVDANGKVSIAHFGGNVGIGTSNAVYKLDVAGVANVSSVLLVNAMNVVPTVQTTFGQANLAFAKSNTANITADVAFGQANLAYAKSNTANITADAAFGQSNLAFAKANDASTIASAAYDKANTGGDFSPAFNQANLAYATANGAQTWVIAAFGQANLAYATANGAQTWVIAAFGQANLALAKANTANITADRAFGQANLAFNQANLAYAKANAALANGTTTLDGSLTITGDLTVRGNTTLGDASTDTITINGNSITLGNNQNIDAGTMFIDATNNRVGIGTTSIGSSVKLEVFDSSGAGRIKANTNVSIGIATFDAYANTSGGFLRAYGPTYGSPASLGNRLVLGADTNSLGLVLLTDGFASTSNGSGNISIRAGGYDTAAERVFIDKNGSIFTGLVGFGITPTANLHVSGNANITGPLVIGTMNIVPTISTVFDAANSAPSAFAQANLAYAKANTANITADVAFGQANLAFAKANAANVLAFNALPNTSGVTFNGDLNVSGNLTAANIAATNFFDLTPRANADFKEGRLYYSSEEKTWIGYGDYSDFEQTLGEREWVRCRNSTANTIAKGKAVYVTGVHIPGNPVHGHHPTIDLADASDINKKDVIGIAGHDIAAGQHGYIVVRGYIEGINTASLTAASRVHLGFNGDIVNDAPEYPNWPMDLGICLTSNTTNGTMYVTLTDHSMERLRVQNSARVGGDLTVEGSFTVLGSQSIVTTNSLEVGTQYIYMGYGDSIPNSAVNFTGTGLNDIDFKGHYTSNTNTTFYVAITAVSPDKFSWGYANNVYEQSNVTIQYQTNQLLSNGISIYFNANTGHTLGDRWNATAYGISTDFGIVGNHIDGPNGYTHSGLFRDATDGTFKFFNSYDPEPNGNIDIANTTFNLANLQVKRITATEVYEGSVKLSDSFGTIFDKANTANLTADRAFGQANLAYATANGAQTWSVAAFSSSNLAYATANGAQTWSIAAFAQSNLAYAKANTANITADSALALSISAYNKANAANITADVAFGQANLAYAQANNSLNVAFGQANLAYATANGAQTWSVAAFSKANAALPNVISTVLAGSLYLANTPGFANSSTQTSLSIAGDGSTRGLLTLFGLDKSRSTFQVANSGAFSIQSVSNTASGRHQLTLDSTFTLGSAGSGTIAGSQLSVWEANVWVGSVSAGPTVNAGIMLSRDKSIGFINLGTEVARFDSATGNLLIGRSTSTVGQGVKLDVAGAINASAVLVNGAPISVDYSPAFAKANTANITADAAFGQANLAFAKANSTSYTSNVVISVTDNTNAALRITQTGDGPAFVVEDDTNPDSTQFAISNIGLVTIRATQAYGNFASLTVNTDNITEPVSGGGSVIAITNSNTSTSSKSALMFTGTDNSGTSRHGASIMWGKSGAWTGTSDFGSFLSVYTRADGGSQVERMRIDSNGNMGIGTTTIDPTTWSTANTRMLKISAKVPNDWAVIELTNSNNSGRLWLSSNVADISDPYTYIWADDNTPLAIRAGDHIELRTGNSFDITKTLRLFNTGNVAIGRADAGYKLDVNGTINAAAVLVNGTPVITDYSPAFAQANLAYATANGAQTWAVAAFSQANTANITADASFGKVNLAFAKANTALQNTTGTFAGTLTATGALTASGDVTGSRLISTQSSGNEGGEIVLATAATNNTLSTSVTIDIYQNQLRFFETAGNNRGAFIDLGIAGAGITSNLLAGGSGSSIDTTARDWAVAAFAEANTANITADVAFGQANLAYAQANTALTTGQAAFGRANTANVNAKAAFDAGNVSFAVTNAAFTRANTANINAKAAFDAGNVISAVANAAFNKANSNNGIGNSSTGQVLFNDSGTSNGTINLTFDKTTSTLNVVNINVLGTTSYISANSIIIGESQVNSVILVTSTTNDQIIDSFANTAWRSAHYHVTMNAGTSYQTSQISMLHDGVNAYLTEYGKITTSSSLGEFSVSVISGSVSLNVVPTNAVTTIRMFRTTNK